MKLIILFMHILITELDMSSIEKHLLDFLNITKVMKPVKIYNFKYEFNNSFKSNIGEVCIFMIYKNITNSNGAY